MSINDQAKVTSKMIFSDICGRLHTVPAQFFGRCTLFGPVLPFCVIFGLKTGVRQRSGEGGVRRNGRPKHENGQHNSMNEF